MPRFHLIEFGNFRLRIRETFPTLSPSFLRSMRDQKSIPDIGALIDKGKEMSAAGGDGGRTDTLFEFSIGDNGTVVCTRPAKQVYLITFKSGTDNRLVSSFCKGIILALDIIEQRYDPGVVITTSGFEKFYSNGLDLEHAFATPGFFKDALYPLWRRLLTYPMPTVALINGHAFAGGFMLAMMHDYRIMNPHKGYVCLNENQLGVPLRPPMASVFRQKVSPQTFRKMILESHRFKALDALQEGIVDWLGGLPEALAHIDEFKLVEKAQKGMSGQIAYGVLKAEMWRETVDFLEQWSEDSIRAHEKGMQWQREKQRREENVQQWEKLKAKL